MTTIPHVLRAPCKFCADGGVESPLGYIVPTNGQDVVRCARCDRHQYNAPKALTGKPQRHVRTRANLKPSQRSRIIERANRRCERCGADGILHVGHILSVEDGKRAGLSEDEVNHDENLLAECEECNLGHGDLTMPLRLAVAVVHARIAAQARSKAS